MKKYTIGVDLGGTNTKIALIKSGTADIIWRTRLNTRSYKNKEALLDAIAGAVKSILLEKKIEKADVQGIGIGTPGLVDTYKGFVHYLVNIPGFRNVNVRKVLERKLGLRVFVDNDVNVMALAEARFGAGKGAKNVVCITVGTGVGGGIIIDRKLYRGSTLSAGEIGHIPLAQEGARCNCGGRACMETFVGNSYLVKQVISQIKSGRKSRIKDLVHTRLSLITPKILTQAAKENDKLAVETWRRAGKFLGLALVSVVNMLNPEIIIIGGGMSGAGRFLLQPARETVRKRAMQLPGKYVKIVKARLGEDAGVIGAAELVCKE